MSRNACNEEIVNWTNLRGQICHFGQIANFQEARWLLQTWYQAHRAHARRADCTLACSTKLMLTDNQAGDLVVNYVKFQLSATFLK